jgi:hypothetical protein
MKRLFTGINTKLKNSKQLKIFYRMKSASIDRKISIFEYKTINDIFINSSKINKNAIVFGKIINNNNNNKTLTSSNVGAENFSFDWITYSEMEKLVGNFRKVLTDHNISKNDKVAIISNNRY